MTEIKPTTINHEAHFNYSSHQLPIPQPQEHHNYFAENHLLNTHNYQLENQIADYNFYQHAAQPIYDDGGQPHIIYRYDNNPEIQLLKSDSPYFAAGEQFSPEIKYEITPDDERDHAGDKSKIIEARDELMNILAKSHKIIERAAGNKKNRTKRRSLLTLWGSITKSSGKEEESFEDEEEEEESLTSTDKWLAGCLIQCIYKKNGAIDRLGYPTLDGIVDLYTAGSTEQPFFIYSLRAVNKCLKHVSNKYNVNRKKKPSKETACSIAFDVFDCVSDLVEDYCEF